LASAGAVAGSASAPPPWPVLPGARLFVTSAGAVVGSAIEAPPWQGGHAAPFAYLQADRTVSCLLPTLRRFVLWVACIQAPQEGHDPRDLPLGKCLGILKISLYLAMYTLFCGRTHPALC